MASELQYESKGTTMKVSENVDFPAFAEVGDGFVQRDFALDDPKLRKQVIKKAKADLKDFLLDWHFRYRDLPELRKIVQVIEGLEI